MFEELKNNIDIEIQMINELSHFTGKLDESSPGERRIIKDIVNSIKKRLRIINSSFPHLLADVSLGEKFTHVEKKDFESVNVESYPSRISIDKKDKEKFFEELRISEDLIRKLKRRKPEESIREESLRIPSAYSKLANRTFLGMSRTLVERGSFSKMISDLKKSNLNILSTTYVSLMLFTIMLASFAGIITYIFFIFFYFSLELPIIHLQTEGFLIRSFKLLWIIAAFPLITWLSFFFYPGSEKSSLRKKIDRELPFVVIHMGSISGSGIEPVEIFKIIGSSGEYKYTSKEVKKLLNQINVYGYDLVTALVNVARSTPSGKLTELLNGLATSLNSGGDLEKFFEERAKSLLLEYRLEREKFIKTAETFMDIYISVVIATPMILLLLLIMISVSGVQVGLGIGQMTFLIISLVSLINIIFLVFLHLKQPAY